MLTWRCNSDKKGFLEKKKKLKQKGCRSRTIINKKKNLEDDARTTVLLKSTQLTSSICETH